MMIKQSDYFGGVIISYLLNSRIAKSAPVLCDESKNCKSLSFLTDNGEYNLYIKYSRNFITKGKDVRKCSFQFTNEELEKIKKYKSEKRNLYIALICTNEKLTETEIAFVTAEEAFKVLDFDNVNTKKQIHVKHLKGKHDLNIWGTMLDETKSLKIRKDFDWIFRKGHQKLIA